MTHTSSNRPPGTDVAGGRGKLLHLLAQCGERLQRDLGPLVDQTLRRLDDTLYDLADKAESDRLHRAYFEAQRTVRRERSNLKRRFLRNLADGIALFQDVRRSLQLSRDSIEIDLEELGLVDNDDLEETLALSNMISKAENRYAAQLRDLTRHFADLVGDPDLKLAELPVAPQAICGAFRTAVTAVPDMELTTALVVYKVFDKQVMDNLGPAYDACIEVAVAQGLKPSGHRIVGRSAEPAEGPRRPAGAADASGAPSSCEPMPARAATRGAAPPERTSTHGPSSPTGPSAGVSVPRPGGRSSRAAWRRPGDGAAATPAMAGAGGGAPSAAGAIGDPTFEQLRVLLHGRQASLPESASIPVMATADLLAALSEMQRRSAMTDDRLLSPRELREALVTDLDIASMLDADACVSPPRHRLERSDADTMDLMFLLFEQILGAPDIPDAMKVLVSRLQIPYVKLAVQDRTFFDAPHHPARVLINRIAEAAIGWNDDGQRGDDSLYGCVRRIVERVVTERETEPQLFVSLHRELSEYLERDARQARLAEARTIHMAGAREAHQRGRRRVMAAIDERLRGRADLPVVVASIVYDGWAEVLLRALEQQGEESQAWRHRLRLLDWLLWSIEPKVDPGERRELLRRIPELLRHLREQLGTVMSDQDLIARWLKDLQTLHILVLRGPAAMAPPDVGAARSRPAVRHGGAAADADRADTDIDALPLGTWIAIARDDASLYRAKLAWRSSDGEQLVLVNRNGRKAFDLSRSDLSTLLEQGLAEVIGDCRRALVDRAMAAVRETLTVQ